MAAQLYSDASVYIDGALLVEQTDVTVDRKSGAIVQLTQAKGFAGMSPGAAMMEISFDNAVPATGMEFDPGDAMQNMRTVSITVFAGGASLTSTGFITEDTFKKAVNKEASLSMKMTAEFAQWQ